MPASVGTVWVDVRLNVGDVSRQLQAALRGATGNLGGVGAGIGAGVGDDITRSLGARLSGMGSSMSKMGQQLSVGLSLPLLAIGKSATTSFNAFDKAMTQVNALVGVSTEQTDK